MLLIISLSVLGYFAIGYGLAILDGLYSETTPTKGENIATVLIWPLLILLIFFLAIGMGCKFLAKKASKFTKQVGPSNMVKKIKARRARANVAPGPPQVYPWPSFDPHDPEF